MVICVLTLVGYDFSGSDYLSMTLTMINDNNKVRRMLKYTSTIMD